MQTKFYLFILSIFVLVSCSNRQERLINSIESAVDDYNNGDSTSLIILIVIGVIIGILWFLKQNNKNKWHANQKR